MISLPKFYVVLKKAVPFVISKSFCNLSECPNYTNKAATLEEKVAKCKY